jgi:hypothetical protein
MNYESKDLEGNGRGRIDVLSRELTGRQEIQETPLSV